MLIKGFHHLKIDVADMQRSLDFYLGILEFKVIVRYELENGGSIVQVSPTGKSPGLELWYEPPNEGYHLSRLHFALEVNNTLAVVENLRQKNIAIEREPFHLGAETIAFIRDPDDYLIEIYQLIAA